MPFVLEQPGVPPGTWLSDSSTMRSTTPTSAQGGVKSRVQKVLQTLYRLAGCLHLHRKCLERCVPITNIFTVANNWDYIVEVELLCFDTHFKSCFVKPPQTPSPPSPWPRHSSTAHPLDDKPVKAETEMFTTVYAKLVELSIYWINAQMSKKTKYLILHLARS